MGFDQQYYEDAVMRQLYERWAKRAGETKVLEWRLTKAVKLKYLELASMYADCEEGSDVALAIEEEIRSLPGFPCEAGPNTVTVIETTDIQH